MGGNKRGTVTSPDSRNSSSSARHETRIYLSAEQATCIVGVLVPPLLSPATHWHTPRA